MFARASRSWPFRRFSPPVRPRRAPRIPPNAAVKSYRGQPGDSAWRIAEEFLGRGDYHPIIYDLNDLLSKEPFLLTPGQTLHLPITDGGPRGARRMASARRARRRPPRSVEGLKAREEMNLWRMYRAATGTGTAATIVFKDESCLRMRERVLLVIHHATATAAVGTSGKRRIEVAEGTVVAGLAALKGCGHEGSRAPLDVRIPSWTVGVRRCGVGRRAARDLRAGREHAASAPPRGASTRRLWRRERRRATFRPERPSTRRRSPRPHE